MAKTEIAETKETKEFVNPWEPGVSYKTFLNAIPDKVSIKDYLTGKLGVDNEAELITWLENDIKHYKENLKQK